MQEQADEEASPAGVVRSGKDDRQGDHPDRKRQEGQRGLGGAGREEQGQVPEGPDNPEDHGGGQGATFLLHPRQSVPSPADLLSQQTAKYQADQEDGRQQERNPGSRQSLRNLRPPKFKGWPPNRKARSAANNARTSGTNSATAYHFRPTRHLSSRPSKRLTPARPSERAVSTTAASEGPKLPRKTRPRRGEGNEAPARATGIHNAQESAYARAKKTMV